MEKNCLHWRVLGLMTLSLVGLAAIAYVVLSQVEEISQIKEDGWPVAMQQVTVSRPDLKPVDAAATRYINGEYRFALDVPKTWGEYKVYTTDFEDKSGKMFAVSLPVAKFREALKSPDDLQHGVMLAGVQAYTKKSIATERKRCAEKYQAVIDRYREAEKKGRTITMNADESEGVDRCLSLRDPETLPEKSPLREGYLGENADYYFFWIAFEAFDNGFRKVPSDLSQDIATVKMSFQSW